MRAAFAAQQRSGGGGGTPLSLSASNNNTSFHRRRRGNAESHNTLRLDPNHIIELHEPHPLTYYSKMDGSAVCDRCHKLCFDEGWRCDKPECEYVVSIGGGEKLVPTRPFFCTKCYSDAARLQSECLGAVIAEKANKDTQRKNRTPNLRTNWRADPGLALSQGAIHFENLVQAVIFGHLERVKEIVDHSEFSRQIQIEDTLLNNNNSHKSRTSSSSSSSISFAGKTPLLLAAEGGHRAIVTLLLERGANRETSDVRYGMTPLMIASSKGHSSVVDELVHVGVSIDRLSSAHGYSACHYAAANGHAGVLRRLLKFGSDVLLRTPQGRTPLVVAACNGHLEAVVELAQHMLGLTSAELELDFDDDNYENYDDEGYLILRHLGQTTGNGREDDFEEEDDLDDEENDDDAASQNKTPPSSHASTTNLMTLSKLKRGKKRTASSNNSSAVFFPSSSSSSTLRNIKNNNNTNSSSLSKKLQRIAGGGAPGGGSKSPSTIVSHSGQHALQKTSIALDSILLPDNEGYTAIDIAISKGHNSVVSYLQKVVDKLRMVADDQFQQQQQQQQHHNTRET